MLMEDRDKTRKRLLTLVTRFAVLFFLPSCCACSLIILQLHVQMVMLANTQTVNEKETKSSCGFRHTG